MRRVFYGSAVTISGRLRGHVGFTQRANTPFQGLAADGNKLALFRLLRAGFQVCGFIHDEVLVLISDDCDHTAAVQQVQQILVESMQELCPDVSIACESLLADRWYKDVDEQPIDSQGRIVPYRGQTQVGQGKPTQAAAKQSDKRNIRGRRKPVYDPDTIWSFCDAAGTPTVKRQATETTDDLLVSSCLALPDDNLPFSDPSDEWVAGNEGNWCDARDEDVEYLIGPRNWPTSRCFYCDGYLVHSEGCKALRASWLPVLEFGKHKGKPLADVPERYLRWLLRADAIRDVDVRKAARAILGIPEPVKEHEA